MEKCNHKQVTDEGMILGVRCVKCGDSFLRSSLAVYRWLAEEGLIIRDGKVVKINHE